MGGWTGGADCAALRLSPALPSAHPGADPDLVVRLYVVVDHGPLRPGVARPWRLHGRRRLCDGAVMEPSWRLAMDRHSDQHGGSRRARGDRRLSLLSLPYHRALFR